MSNKNTSPMSAIQASENLLYNPKIIESSKSKLLRYTNLGRGHKAQALGHKAAQIAALGFHSDEWLPLVDSPRHKSERGT